MTSNEYEILLYDRIEMIKLINKKYDLENNAYISFSGGKDSTVLHYLIDLALPNNTIKLRDGLHNDVTSELESLGTKNIGGVNYYIYKNKLGSSNYMQYSLDLVLF